MLHTAKPLALALIALLASAGNANAADSAARERVKAAYSDAQKGKRTIKEAQRDPASFELVSVSWHPNADALCYTYRSKNGFGGVNVSRAIYGRATGKIAYSEKVKDKDFASVWAVGCSDADKIPFNL